MIKIVCKCGRLLATKENGWFEILGKTEYRSNGKEGFITCTKCKKETKVN